MRTLASTIAAVFFVLFVLTTFISYPPAQVTAHDVGFKDDQIDIGLRYTFERRFFFWGTTALEVGLLCVLALTNLGRRWADRLLAWTGNRRILAALGMGLTFAVVHEVLYFPLGVGRWYHARVWEMSNRDFPTWLRDHFLGEGLYLAEGAIVVGGLYALLTLVPRFWWLLAPIGVSLLGVAYAMLAPILISPLFNDFTPLSKTEWKDQQYRVQALIDRAGIPVQEILVMNGSRQGNHTNAYFAGFGPTRRIVLYDTLLKNHTEAEIESVLAHEIGHWQHDHIVKGFLIGIPAAVLGCFLLHLVLRFAMTRSPWNLQSVADPAGLPVILLATNLGLWAILPAQNAVSRYFERQADTASLTLAGQPDAFIATERKMAVTNKSNVAPTPWNVWLFSTHPPVVERIRQAEEWKKTHGP
jgi:STE24 endopeptidase